MGGTFGGQFAADPMLGPGLLAGGDPSLRRVRHRLRRALGSMRGGERLSPISQLAWAMVGEEGAGEEEAGQAGGGDDAGWAMFSRLRRAYSTWERVVREGPERLEAAVAGIPGARRRASRLLTGLGRLLAWRGELSLDFLEPASPEAALRRLRNGAGLGPVAAAGVLNFSILNKRVMVVDAVVRRVAGRLGLVVERRPDGTRGADLVHAELAHAELAAQLDPAWDGDDLYELHWLLKETGRAFCAAGQPRCHRCPLADLCPSARVLN